MSNLEASQHKIIYGTNCFESKSIKNQNSANTNHVEF